MNFVMADLGGVSGAIDDLIEGLRQAMKTPPARKLYSSLGDDFELILDSVANLPLEGLAALYDANPY